MICVGCWWWVWSHQYKLVCSYCECIRFLFYLQSDCIGSCGMWWSPVWDTGYDQVSNHLYTATTEIHYSCWWPPHCKLQGKGELLFIEYMSVNIFFSLDHLQGLILNWILQLSPARDKTWSVLVVMVGRIKKYESLSLVSQHFGFWKSVSTDNALYKLTESILNAWSRRECVAGILFDLTKVFDCVNHELLIHKLQYYGIRGVTLDWFRSYLFNRKQRVKMKLISTLYDCCNWRNIKHGVPSGSVLGQLSFNMLHK